MLRRSPIPIFLSPNSLAHAASRKGASPRPAPHGPAPTSFRLAARGPSPVAHANMLFSLRSKTPQFADSIEIGTPAVHLAPSANMPRLPLPVSCTTSVLRAAPNLIQKNDVPTEPRSQKAGKRAPRQPLKTLPIPTWTLLRAQSPLGQLHTSRPPQGQLTRQTPWTQHRTHRRETASEPGAHYPPAGPVGGGQSPRQ